MGRSDNRNHGHRGRGNRGGRGGRGGHHHRDNGQSNQWRDRNENQAPRKPYERPQIGPISLEFPEYDGIKVHELPEKFVEFLTKKDGKFEKTGTSEEDVGITVFRNPELPGFEAILKHRFSDFIVNEIDQDGKIVRLTSLEVPKGPPPKNNEEEFNPGPDGNFPTHASLSDEIKPLFSPVSWIKLVQLAKKFLNPEKSFEREEVKLDVTEKTKEQRRMMHKHLKFTFKHLTSTTEDGKNEHVGKKFIVVFCHTGCKVRQRSNRTSRSEDRGKFLHFVMHKMDVDSTVIFTMLREFLFPNVPKSNSKFKIAGLKDRRAKTTQNVSMPMISPERLKGALGRLYQLRNVFIGNFTFKNTCLELGDLGGNHFTIALRCLATEAIELASKALDGLKENGFVNYFGLQRFGTVQSVKTSDVGLALIKSQWTKAIELILQPRPNEDCKVARGRAFWWMYRDAEEALNMIDKDCTYAALERLLLQGLMNCDENDLVGAFDSLPKNSRILYLHAYQSLIWNRAVSERFKLYGDEVLIGDLVLLPDPSGKFKLDCLDKLPQTVLEDKAVAIEVEQSEFDGKTDDKVKKVVKEVGEDDTAEILEEIETTETIKEAAETGDAETGAAETGTTETGAAETIGKKYELLNERIVTVTEENKSEYTLFDVIMPVPGWRVQYPKNEGLKEIYDRLLKEDGLDEGFESLRHKTDLYSLPGTYRNIVVKPWNFSYRFTTYNNANEDLVLSDVELLRNYNLRPCELQEGATPFNAVVVEMSLPSSAYATMALREAMKTDTSKNAHSRLTEEYNTKFGVKRSGDDGDSNQPTKRLKRNFNDGPLPKGAILVIKGLKGISNRESVRDSFEPFGIEKRQVAYIEYAREEGEAKLRLKETNAAVSLLQKLKAHEAESGKPFKIDDKEVSITVMEGEEEEEYLAKVESIYRTISS